MARIHWKGWSLAAACLVLAAYSFGLLYEGFFAEHYSGLFTYPFVDEPAATRAYDRLPPGAPIAAREHAARRLIEADPTNSESWNATSYVQSLKAGGMSPAALQSLDRSYAMSFFDRQGSVWRIGYALDNWADLTPSLRSDVLAEARVALGDRVIGPKLSARLRNVQGPEGRLAAAMILASQPPLP